jgi:hypothetical protein
MVLIELPDVHLLIHEHHLLNLLKHDLGILVEDSYHLRQSGLTQLVLLFLLQIY